ncbi:conjugal transfer protein TraW, partial [Klebsiella quasipneumoniae]|nr:conjugal transfer protein TraW [Klebsiella quasipneumoniae]
MKLFDPAFEVTRDLADQNGTVFARKGQRISPFDVIPVFNETLYFIDGDDKEQLAWMQQQKPQTPIHKVILINGNIKDTADV